MKQLSILHIVACAALALGACGRQASQAASSGSRDDPNKPAVVSLPLPPVPTVKPDTTDSTEVRIVRARTEFAVDYAVLGAAAVIKDFKTIMSVYSPAAVLHLPDSTVRGPGDIAAALISFSQRPSAGQLRRNPLDTRILPDSMVSDSGIYVIANAKLGAPPLVTGRYSTVWRMRPHPAHWVILSDRLYGAPSARPGKAAPGPKADHE